MPIITGSLSDVGGDAIPPAARPEVWFHLPRPMRRGSRIVARKAVQATIDGASWSVDIEATEHALFDDGRPAHMLVELRWFDPDDLLMGRDLLKLRLSIPETNAAFADIVPPPGDIPAVYIQEIDPTEQWPGEVIPRSLWLNTATSEIKEWVI